MVEIMRELGKESNLTQDIYPLVEKRGKDLGTKWKARVRATLEENSSDVDGWLGKYDLFENRDKGKGFWVLRDLGNSSAEERLKLWDKIKKIPKGEIEPSYIRELKIYKGGTGICRDDSGICISILNTGKHYPDDIFEDGVLYHYPDTPKRHKSFDMNETNSVKKCSPLNLPIFCILPGNTPKKRKIRLGWVEGYDDDCKWFLIKFSEKQPEKEKEEKRFVGKEKRNREKLKQDRIIKQSLDLML